MRAIIRIKRGGENMFQNLCQIKWLWCNSPRCLSVKAQMGEEGKESSQSPLACGHLRINPPHCNNKQRIVILFSLAAFQTANQFQHTPSTWKLVVVLNWHIWWVPSSAEKETTPWLYSFWMSKHWWGKPRWGNEENRDTRAESTSLEVIISMVCHYFDIRQRQPCKGSRLIRCCWYLSKCTWSRQADAWTKLKVNIWLSLSLITLRLPCDSLDRALRQGYEGGLSISMASNPKHLLTLCCGGGGVEWPQSSSESMRGSPWQDFSFLVCTWLLPWQDSWPARREEKRRKRKKKRRE